MGTEQSPASLASLVRRLWNHLPARRKRQFAALTGLILLSAFAEVVSLGAVLPFLGILTAPQRALSQPIVSRFARLVGVDAPGDLLLPATLAFIAAVLAAGAIRMLLLWASTRLTTVVGAELSLEIYKRTLYQPYPVHLARNSSEIISGITYKSWGVVQGVVLPLQSLVISGVMVVSITAALVVIDPWVALAALGGFGACYALITWITRRRLAQVSQDIAVEQTQVVKALQEGLGGIRDVLLDGTQPVYCDIYQKADLPLRRAHGLNSLIAQSPRFFMESAGMVLIAALAYNLTRTPGGISSALPILGSLALGAQRLLPALQQGYNAWVSIASHRGNLQDTLELLDQPMPWPEGEAEPEPLALRDSIQFDHASFRYSESSPVVIEDLVLRIPKGSRTGFIGATGSGKSTALDLLMGLLVPTSGRILVDGEPLEGPRIRAWQRAIAHVPQAIFLSDTTLAENIAFGIPRDRIDMERVRQAARQAQIAAFIEARPEGYDAAVGERGIRLSGGQRQRIGIARALYKQASVLIFDEATSALDHATEQSVMEAIEGLDRDLTILIIAHRLTTVQRCDTIIELEGGRLVAEGRFSELMDSNPAFRRVAESSALRP